MACMESAGHARPWHEFVGSRNNGKLTRIASLSAAKRTRACVPVALQNFSGSIGFGCLYCFQSLLRALPRSMASSRKSDSMAAAIHRPAIRRTQSGRRAEAAPRLACASGYPDRFAQDFIGKKRYILFTIKNPSCTATFSSRTLTHRFFAMATGPKLDEPEPVRACFTAIRWNGVRKPCLPCREPRSMAAAFHVPIISRTQSGRRAPRWGGSHVGMRFRKSWPFCAGFH